MRRFVAYGPAFVVLITVVVVMVSLPAIIAQASLADARARVRVARQTLDEDSVLARMDLELTQLAQAVRPSAVHIMVAGGLDSGGATGSGWIYDTKGHIVTNAHVVQQAGRVAVQLWDGRVLEARVVGVDRFTDIAVLRVADGSSLIPARRASGIVSQQGQPVYAFGSPFGFKFSMSHGIISGLGREPLSTVDFGGYTNFIQSDAAVNPGNSGGPLVDVRGRVIGMNNAIATGRDTAGTFEGQSAGISFAIPIATIESVVDQIIETGSVSRGFLGISMDTGPGPVIEDPRFKGTGIRVASVVPGRAAAKAGIKPGDIIVAINGQRVPSAGVLRSVVSSLRPGEQASMDLWRDGQPTTVTLRLDELSQRELAVQAVGNAMGFIGLAVDDRELGPTVTTVSRRAASLMGLRPGQVITHVGSAPVTSVGELAEALVDQGFLAGEAVPITIAEPDDRGRLIAQDLVLRLRP